MPIRIRRRRRGVALVVAVAASVAASVAALAPPAVARTADATATAEPGVWQQRRVLTIAHAGGDYEAPHSTPYAFKRAVALGTDVLEMDVRRSADGEVVVVHDDTVDRTTNGTGRVDSFTLTQLQALDSAYWFVPNCWSCRDRDPSEYTLRGIRTGAKPAPPGYSPDDFAIPSLRQILETFPHRVLDIEIKGSYPADVATAQGLAALLAEFGRTDDVIVTSFDDALLQAFVDLAPGVPTSPGVGATSQWFFGGALAAHHKVLQVPPTYNGITVVSEAFVQKAHADGLAVWVWFNGEDEENEAFFTQLVEWGVDGILTGKPSLSERVLEALDADFQPPLVATARSTGRARSSFDVTCPAAHVERCRASAFLLGPRSTAGAPEVLGQALVDLGRGERTRLRFEYRLDPIARWWLRQGGTVPATFVLVPWNDDTGGTSLSLQLRPGG